MGRRKHKAIDTRAAPRVRVKLHIDGDAIGSGKVDLLRHIDRHGGISPAARAMGITYRRAWHLIDTMNSALGGPVVETEVGGARGGGARLTPLGHELIERYEDLAAQVAPATQPILAWLEKRRQR
ncbi:MAG: LysR family transcriptional regulator [Gammaproteobacteria bacterium]|nr:LysR family transcriptional regulator [Gammaproteobacteria bacterium]